MNKFVKFMPLLILIFGFSFVFFGCNDDRQNTKPEPEVPAYTKVSITNLNYEDYIKITYTVQFSDVSYNSYTKNAKYKIIVSITDSEYSLLDVEVKYNNKTYTLNSNTDTEINYSKSISVFTIEKGLYAPTLEKISGKVCVPNKKFSINYYIDGALSKTTTVLYGSTPDEYTPTKDGYYFAGWDKPLTSVKADIETNAIFAPEITLTYMLEGSVYKTVKFGSGVVLGEKLNFKPYDKNLSYWYYYGFKPINFKTSKFFSDTTIYGLIKNEEHGNLSGCDLSITNLRGCNVPENYGDSFSVCAYGLENQVIKIYTTSTMLKLNQVLLLAVDGQKHNQVVGEPVEILETGSDANNCPYIIIRTSNTGYYWFTLVSKYQHYASSFNFNIYAELLTTYTYY